MLSKPLAEMQIAAGNAGAYSQIITPEEYCRIISREHIYIAASDKIIKRFIKQIAESHTEVTEVVELGCGPARIAPMMSTLANINLTAIDLDSGFLAHARQVCKTLPITLIEASIFDYQHSKPVDIFYSQGVHHHVTKGENNQCYLKNIYQQLNTGGYYILADEFIPNYADYLDREIKLVIWYAHVIDHAIQHGFDYLAQEEVKTLIDDLHEGQTEFGYKTDEQIEIVLAAVTEINHAALEDDFEQAQALSQQLLNTIYKTEKYLPSGDQTLDLSREDYKICDAVLREEVEPIGFEIIERKFIGRDEKIGGMVVYLLKKT